MIHSFKFIGEGGAVLELRLDDGKHEVVEELFREIDKQQKKTALNDPPNPHFREVIERGLSEQLVNAAQDQALAIRRSRKLITDIREEEGQKERDRIQKEGVGKVSIVIKKDKS